MARLKFTDWLLGRPLASTESEENKVSVWAGIPMLGLDALSSAAYGPEAALTILIPLGAAGIAYARPIIGIILALLAILYFSYRQTIHAYPNGGGSYIVAKSNLGTTAGLFAAAALMIDYVLTVAVGISAGVGALVSAIPALHPHILAVCLAILALVTIVNLRGAKESGAAFAIPTYGFLITLFGVLAIGIFKVLVSGGRPTPIETPPALPAGVAMATPWLLMRAFASGCTAMTGVEAVSNGIQAFAKPRVQRAQQTLTAIVVALGLLLAGIAFLCNAYGIGAIDPDSSGYQSVISLIVAAVVGRGFAYYVTLGFVVAVLALSANTGFADFPRLCHLIALDDYLPHLFASRGRRLVYSTGILVLAALCGALLIFFRGVTDRLIPLFAVGAFLAFTLSQAGMVKHWLRNREPNWRTSLAVNAVGCVATTIALGIVLVAKFAEGAWITVLLIPTFVALFTLIHRHYARFEKEIERLQPISLEPVLPPVVVLPIKSWNVVVEKALRYAMSISEDIHVVHIVDEDTDLTQLMETWNRCVTEPLLAAGKKAPVLKVMRSPYRRFVSPMLTFVRHLEDENPGRTINVLIPEVVEASILRLPLHNQRAAFLKAVLFLNGGSHVAVTNVPWHRDHRRRSVVDG